MISLTSIFRVNGYLHLNNLKKLVIWQIFFGIYKILTRQQVSILSSEVYISFNNEANKIMIVLCSCTIAHAIVLYATTFRANTKKSRR